MEERNNNGSKMFAFIMMWIPIIAYWNWLLVESNIDGESFFGMCVLGVLFCSIPFLYLFILDEILD